MTDNSTDPNYLDEVDTPLSGQGEGEYNNVEQTILLINRNIGRLSVNQKEIQRIMRSIRRDYYEFRDRGFAAMDAQREGTEVHLSSWLMVRLYKLANNLNSRMMELEAYGVLPEYTPPCEDCEGTGMVAHTDRREGVPCPKCGGAGAIEE